MLRNRQRAGWLRLPDNAAGDPAVKPLAYLPIYEKLMASMRRRRFTLLELGVWNGQSLEMWRDAFPRATVIGVDLVPHELNLGSRVHVVVGDQADANLMQGIREKFAPTGFDVIIDDASHVGVTSARSLQALYVEHLSPGGLYCVEDWGTGYLLDWRDGGRLATRLDIESLDKVAASPQDGVDLPIPMPSHDLGMVGLVKRLIDHTAGGSVRVAQPDVVGEVLAIESMTIWDGIVALRKRNR